MTQRKQLSQEQIAFFQKEGYLHSLAPVYSPNEVQELKRGLDDLMSLLRPGETSKEIREWHESGRF
ncbi:MAG: hypothetical protein WBH55_05565, partial [Bacteroidota bacterium]